MKKIMMTLLLLATVCVNVNAYFLGDHYSGLNIKYVGTEGTEMVCCSPKLHYSIHNTTDETINILENFRGFAAYVLVDLEDEIFYYRIGQFLEDIDIKPDERIEIAVPVNLLEVFMGDHLICLGSDRTVGGEPEVKFCTELFSIMAYRQWDLTTQIEAEGLKEVNGKKILSQTSTSASISIINNEDELLTIAAPWIYLYKMNEEGSYENASFVHGFGVFEFYAEPHTVSELAKDLQLTDLEEGETYFFSIVTNKRDHNVAYSEPFTVDTTTGINNIGINKSNHLEIFTLDGKRINANDESMSRSLSNGIYIVKTDKGTRKVVR